MISFLILLCAVFSRASAAVQCGVPGTDSTARIVGGSEAQPHQFPWVVFLQMQHVPIQQTADAKTLFMACDGSLIDDQWVVTASHCFTPVKDHKMQQVLVVLGAHNLANKDETRLVAPPTKVVTHEKYAMGNNNSKYDIAMVKLPQKLDFANVHSHISPICLPKQGELVSKTACQAVGWGKTGPEENQTPSKVLKVVTHSMLSASECNRVRPEVNDLQVCAGYTDHSTCQGDSGGPLQCENRDKHLVLEGIVSYGEKKCGGPIPAVFTRVDQYLSWINDVKTKF